MDLQWIVWDDYRGLHSSWIAHNRFKHMWNRVSLPFCMKFYMFRSMQRDRLYTILKLVK